jgi:hypothetical protein
VSWIYKATDFMQRLSGVQQDAILQWAGATAAVMAFSKAMAFLGATGPVGVILTIAAGLIALTSGSSEASGALGRIGAAFGRIFSVIGPPVLKFFEAFAEIVTAFVVPILETLAGWLEEVVAWLQRLGIIGERTKQKQGANHRSVSQTPGGMEGIADTYKRMQQSALRMDVNYPKRQVELAEESNKHLGHIATKIDRLQPAVVR